MSDLFLDIDRLRAMAATREDRRVFRRGLACALVLNALFWALVIKGGIWLLS